MTDRLDDLLAGMASDLVAIHRAVPWAEGFAYGKPGRGLDAEHGTDLARTEAEREQGPTYDLAIGDHGARLALQRALPRLARAEVHLIVANAAAGWTKIVTSYGMVALGETPTANHVALSVKVVSILLDSLTEHLPTDPLARRRVERHAFKASQQLTWCLGGFSRALDKGEVSKPSVPRCRNGICPKMSDPKEAGYCGRCGRALRRNGELPSGAWLAREANDEGLTWAKANQNKRAANGLGHGDESLSHAWHGPR